MNETKRNETAIAIFITNLLSFKLFTILLSLILLFSISCSSNEEPPTEKHELVGNWGSASTGYSGGWVNLSIDDNGNITLVVYQLAGISSVYSYNYTYAGKIENNSKYPYTVKLTQTSFYRDSYIMSDAHYNGHTGNITFNNASNCSARVPICAGGYTWVSNERLDFKKQ